MNFNKVLQDLLNPMPTAMADVGLIYHGSRSESVGFTVFTLSNPKSGVSVRLSISNDRGSTTTSFKKEGKKSWHLEEYFKQKRTKDEYDALFFRKSPREYVENLCMIIESDLGEIIKGDQWLDIDRDWMGYK